MSQGWQKRSPTRGDAARHLERFDDAQLGVMPGHSGLIVFDVDDGDPTALIDAFPPLAHLETPSGGCHLIYSHPGGGIGNAKFEAHGCAGDIRADRGYVVMWDRDTWRNVLGGDASATAPPIQRAEAPGKAPKDWQAGNRNDTLNRAVFLAVKQGREAEIPALVAQARAAGLGEEIAATRRQRGRDRRTVRRHRTRQGYRVPGRWPVRLLRKGASAPDGRSAYDVGVRRVATGLHGYHGYRGIHPAGGGPFAGQSELPVELQDGDSVSPHG